MRIQVGDDRRLQLRGAGVVRLAREKSSRSANSSISCLATVPLRTNASFW